MRPCGSVAVAVGAVLAAVGFAVGLALVLDPHGLSPRTSILPRSFAWLMEQGAPGSWRTLSTDGGTAFLLQPTGFRRVHSDPGAVSVAVIEKGTYEAYLNATPRQDDEQLHGWARFRIGHLVGEDARSAREIASVEDVRLHRQMWSCVLDRYVTKVDQNHFTEIACIVKGARYESVVVAAAATDVWQRFRHTLEEAVAGFEVL